METDGFGVNINYHINNDEIKSMIESNILAYASQIQCTATWYRNLMISDSDKQTIKLPAGEVHGKVEICPCIIVLKNVLSYENEDFSEDFKGISFSLNKGEVVAIGEKYKFNADYDNDIIKKGDSIVSFVEDNETSVMYGDLNADIIQIHLPPKQFKQYVNIGKYDDYLKIPLLNSIYVVPVIVQAIYEIEEGESDPDSSQFDQNAWYKTIRLLIRKAAKGDDNKFHTMLQEPVKTAEILLNDNSAHAIKSLSRLSGIDYKEQ